MPKSVNSLNSLSRPGNHRIRWLDLKRAAEKIVGRSVEIHASTELPPHLRAAVEFFPEEGIVVVVLNFQHIKSEDDALKALAHELAHVKLGSVNHGVVHVKNWEELYETLKKEYFRFAE